MEERKIYTLLNTPIFKFNLKKSHLKLNKDLIKLAYSLKDKDKGVVKSNKRGYQSQLISDKNSIIKKFIKKFQIPFSIFADDIKLNKPWTCHFDLPWINISSKGAYNIYHAHGEAHFAGVYYIQVPKDSGQIKFLKNKYVFDYFPNQYDLLIFPGWLQHSVSKNKSNEDRISIAWNMYIKQ
jgi:uncharacterized protein (TIGR02466 family)